MKRLIIILILIINKSYGLTIELSQSKNNFFLNISEKKLSMKSPSFDYSFKVNDCNRLYVKNFVEEYERKKRKMRIPASRNSNNIVLREGKKTVNINRKSTLGKYLQTVPSKILKLSIIESKRCSK